MNGIRYPNITAKSNEEQLLAIRSYLHQLVDQLNVALVAVEAQPAVEAAKPKASSGKSDGASAQSTFSDIKGLIIKSADIVNAYYEEISHRLEGVYVAESDFGTYTEKTDHLIEENSTNITSIFSDIQTINETVDGIENSIKEIDVSAYIKAGLLYYVDSNGNESETELEDGTPVYGLEIGQRVVNDDGEVQEVKFDKFARFVSDKLSFYDANDNEVAYISDKKLYITHVEITGSLRQGGFVSTTQTTGDIVEKWVGIGG